jgi:hypothetical protein
VIARPARQEEIPYLRAQLALTDHEQVDLMRGFVWVVEEDGEIVGMLPLRLIFQPEPMLIFDKLKNKHSRRKAAFLLAEAMEKWIGDRSQNKTGIHSYFAVIKDKTFEALARHWGALRIYRDCRIYGRDL